MYLEYNTVVALCWFFGSGGKKFLMLHTYLVYNTVVCSCVSFWLWREIVLKMRTPFDFLWAVSTKKSYWVTLLWSTSQCVYFVRPNTLLLCIFLFYIFLLYRTDPQVEVQIRILFKDKYMKLCQNMNTGNHTMISCTQFLRKNLIGFLYFYRNNSLAKYVSHKIQTFYYCISLSWIVWIYSLTITIVSQKYQELSVQVEISE